MQHHDLVVIGAGPGGYPAAIRAAQLGLDVAIVEKEPQLGGTCVRIGCIPSKALLESSERYAATREQLAAHGVLVGTVGLDLAVMQKRKEAVVKSNTNGLDYLIRKNKITRYTGTGRLLAAGRVAIDGADTEIECQHIIIATGSTSAVLPGVAPDGDRIGTSTQALAYSEVPKKLIVIGAGAIGLELGSVWQRLGAKVTVLEYLPRILPGIDAEVAASALKLFQQQGIEFSLDTKVQGASVTAGGVSVQIQGAKALRAERVLLAVGRTPNTQGLGLHELGIATDERGRIRVDAAFATNLHAIYAVGDCIAGPMLAHKATEEGIACVEGIVLGSGHVNYRVIPNIVYTQPEIATVGATEEQLAEDDIKFTKGVFPFSANGRARCIGDTEGFVKILADAATDRILGVHIIGARAGDLIAEAVAAMEFGASSEDITRTCHAHPTLSEAVHEAALAVEGRAIHI